MPTQKQLDTAQNRIESLKDRLLSKDSQIADLKQDCKNLNSTINMLRKHEKTLLGKIAKLERTLNKTTEKQNK